MAADIEVRPIGPAIGCRHCSRGYRCAWHGRTRYEEARTRPRPPPKLCACGHPTRTPRAKRCAACQQVFKRQSDNAHNERTRRARAIRRCALLARAEPFNLAGGDPEPSTPPAARP